MVDQSMIAEGSTEGDTTLFELDDTDARRVEQLYAQLTAVEIELSMIFSRALGAKETVQVKLRPSSPRVIGGKPVGFCGVGYANWPAVRLL